MLSPEIRSERLFRLNYLSLRERLTGRIVALPDSNVRLRLTHLQPWSRQENSHGGYQVMTEMQPGELCILRVQGQHLVAMVNALEDRKPGACLKLHRAIMLEGDIEIPLNRTTDIAQALGLDPDERPRPYLAYLNDTKTLFVVRRGIQDSLVREERVNLSTANQAWDSGFSSQSNL